MTPSDLKYNVSIRGNDTHFFSRRSMAFFGDTMRNYGVRSAEIYTNYDSAGNYVSAGVMVKCWELYRKNPVKYGLKNSVFFSKESFKVFQNEH